MPRPGSLLFSIEQWELIRRLRNSGLTKEQIGQAFDDLNKIEQDLGSMYNLPATTISNNSSISTSSSFPATPQLQTPLANDSKFGNNQILSNMQIFQMAKNLTSMAQTTRQSNPGSIANGTGYHGSNGGGARHEQVHTKSESSSNEHFSNGLNASMNGSQTLNNQATAAVSVVNAHFSGLMDSDQEAKQIEEFRLKGEVVIHGEISFFVYKHDLKQSQIARMAGVNQAYVSKFLRGEFFDLSENGKSLIYKWYLRYLKNSSVFHQAHNISVNPNVVTTTNGQIHQLNPHDKSSVVNVKSENNSSPQFTSFNNVTNTTYETPKRSRFSFKSEHLIILEKAFVENHYPDQKRREELSKQCNELKTGSERVTEQIVTHWFQNKRKITRKLTMDDRASISPNDGNNASMNGGGGMNGGDYGNDDNLSYQDVNDSNLSNGNITDYQNESPNDYQEFVDNEESEVYSNNSNKAILINSIGSKNRHVSNDSNDY